MKVTHRSFTATSVARSLNVALHQKQAMFKRKMNSLGEGLLKCYIFYDASSNPKSPVNNFVAVLCPYGYTSDGPVAPGLLGATSGAL